MHSLTLGSEEQENARRLVEMALAEDLGSAGDLTSRALIPLGMQGTVNVVARADGILAGLPVARMVYEQLDPAVVWNERLSDAARVTRGTIVATATGPLQSLLSGERTALNFLMRLSGVASLTRKFVDAAAGNRAVILDTRKTLPGWRGIDKYAVRAGGGTNHRTGLFDGCLIKDNHLAAWRSQQSHPSIAAAVEAARKNIPASIPIEVEVDTLDQLKDVLDAKPEIVLLDNMDLYTLRASVQLRDRVAHGVQLEASGGVTLETVAAIAATGVDRISVGAITHSAPALDLAFDWP
jgi:nicotinate-nucleotide pyrophosphorylase (carboxylating)